MKEEEKFFLLATARHENVVSEKEEEKVLKGISITTLEKIVRGNHPISHINQFAERALQKKMEELDEEHLEKYLRDSNSFIREVAVKALKAKEKNEFIKKQLGL